MSTALVPYRPAEQTFTQQLASSTKEGYAWLRDYITAIKSGRWHPFTPVERKARAATRNEPWGPTGTQLHELADLSRNPVDASIIFAVVELRLSYPAHKWRNVYKALTVLEFLVKRGEEGCVTRAREEFVPKLEDLGWFEYTAPDGKDVGINVRHRAQAINALLRDDRRLAAEREAFKKSHSSGGGNKYQGYTRDQMQSGWGGPPGNTTSGWAAAAAEAQGEGGQGSREGAEESAEEGGGGATPSPERRDSGTAEYRRRSPDSALRNAGETKGVTMSENSRYLAALRKLLERPENRACADCKDASAGSRPSWASINTGAFICMRCAGIHRGLGVHVSKVRSCTLDTWLPGQVAFMAHTGNAIANSYWEAGLAPEAAKPSYANLAELETFIRRKYVTRDFASKGACWPPSEEFEDDHIRAILKEMAVDPAVQRRRSGSMLTVPSPSSKQPTEAAEPPAPAAEEPQPAAAEEEALPPQPPPAPLINLLDFDLEPLPAATGGSPGAAGTAEAPDTMLALEAVFLASSLSGDEGAGGGVVQRQQLPPGIDPADPFAGSVAWDMGRVLHQPEQQTPPPPAAGSNGGSATAVARGTVWGSQDGGMASPGSAASSPSPKPSPRPDYCPPWASATPPSHVLATISPSLGQQQMPAAQQQQQPHHLHSPSAPAGHAAFETGFAHLHFPHAASTGMAAPAAAPIAATPQPAASPSGLPPRPPSAQNHYHNLQQQPQQPYLNGYSSYGFQPGAAAHQQPQPATPGMANGSGASPSPSHHHHAKSMPSMLAAPPASPLEAKLQSMMLSGLSGFTSQAERVTAVKQPSPPTGRPSPATGGMSGGGMAAMKAAKQGQGSAPQQITATSAWGPPPPAAQGQPPFTSF